MQTERIAELIARAADVPQAVAEAVTQTYKPQELADLTPEQILRQQHAGMTRKRAERIIAAAALSRRLAHEPLKRGMHLRSPSDVYSHLHAYTQAPNEHFVMLTLDTRGRLQETIEVSQGCLTSSMVHPRSVFRPALMDNAAAIVVVHNHPSGDPTPSSEDWRITRRLEKAGSLLGVPLLDHIVIADGGWSSMREAGVFDVDNFEW